MPRLLYHTNLEELAPRKDITLGLGLERSGVLASFSDTGSTGIALAELLRRLDDDTFRIRCLDDVILKNLDDDVKSEFPEEVYFLRLSLLTDFCSACSERRVLTYTGVGRRFSEEEGPICEFCKKVLNEFY